MDRLRKEAVSIRIPEANKGWQYANNPRDPLSEGFDNAIMAGIPTISKDIERMEIEIDNCLCEDELKQWKAKNPIIPYPALKLYNLKMNELLPKNPIDFTDGPDTYQ